MPQKNRMEEGDLLQIDRGTYSHWAVNIGNDEVVHLDGIDGRLASHPGHSVSVSGVQFNKAEVKREHLSKVLGTSNYKINNRKDRLNKCYEGREVVKRALSMIGPVDYNILRRNCEHFASWCRYDKSISQQIENILVAVLIAVPLVMVGRLII